MDEQTRKLLEECSSGCRMAVDSFGQIREYVQDTELLRLIDDYTEKHRQLEKEAAALLKEAGKEEKEPGIMATTLSWFTTGVKLTMDSSNTQVAKVLMDGCNMGIKTLGEKANRYGNADRKASALTQKIIRAEEDLMKKLQEFL